MFISRQFFARFAALAAAVRAHRAHAKDTDRRWDNEQAFNTLQPGLSAQTGNRVWVNTVAQRKDGDAKSLSPFNVCRRADPPQASWYSIWSGNPKRRYLLAAHYAWAVYVLLFSSMMLNIRAYGRDHLSINTIAMGFSEILGVLIGMYLILYTRRRWLWSGCLSIFAGCLAYFTWLIPSNREPPNFASAPQSS